MKLTSNKVEEYVQQSGTDGIYEAIASAARICYQTDATKMKMQPKEFVENILLKNGHSRCLEFGTVYLTLSVDNMTKNDNSTSTPFSLLQLVNKYKNNSYSKVFLKSDSPYLSMNSKAYITTNMRVIMQGDYETDFEAWKNSYDKNWLDDLKYLCKPTENHYKRRTFNMVLSRGASDDLRTHISLSSMCESTRFCNYSKGKYGNQLTGIKPYWMNFNTDEEVIIKENSDLTSFSALSDDERQFLASMAQEETEYLKNAKNELQPQQLKRLFPLWAKCELRLCGFDDAWDNFMWRRLDEHADPECTEIAKMIQKLRK